MSQTDKNRAAAVGLDIGTSRIVAARPADTDIHYEIQLNAFVEIPYSKLTENALKKERIPHSLEGDRILVHGNESERFADLLNAEIRRPMTRGVLNPDEPESLRLVREITTALAGKASQKNQKLCFTIPAAPLGSEDNLTYHEATLRQILSEQGHEVRSINEGLAVVYAEMDASNYTGIGISCGGGLCNVCLAYLAVPILSFSIPKAGDFIDASAAAVTGERANRVRLIKEEGFHLNGHFTEKIHQALGVYYDDMMQALVSGLTEAFRNARSVPKITRPVPLVLSGGSATPKGFRDRFEKILRESDFPIPLSEVRLAENPHTATAKGALIAALSEA